MPDPIKSLTIDQLYEAYMDIGEWGAEGAYGSQDFTSDVYDWFGASITGKSKEEWAAQYGMYLPVYDPTSANLAAQEREIDYRDAENIHNLSKEINNQVYATAVGDVSASVATDIDKSKQIAGGLGLRSGSLETATADATRVAQDKIKSLGDNLRLEKKKDQNTYNNAMVESTLDYDKSLHETKEEFYDRTLAMIDKLTDIGAFAEAPCPNTGAPPAIVCPEDSGNPGATVCNQDECNLYTGLTEGGTAEIEGIAIQECMASGLSLEQCQEDMVEGLEGVGVDDLIESTQDFGQGGIGDETYVDIVQPGLENLGECAKIGACRAAAYIICGANVFTKTEDCVDRNCGKACI